MLLVITSTNDKSSDQVVSKVHMESVRVNMDGNPGVPMSFMTSSSGSTVVTVDGVDARRIKSVWYRLAWAYPAELRNYDNPYGVLNRFCREELVKYLYPVLGDANWVSNPYAFQRAENKMFQLLTAEKVGLEVPRTLSSSRAGDVEDFRTNLPGNMVVKYIAKAPVIKEDRVVALMTHRVPPEMELDLSMIGTAPAIFQEEIPKVLDLRVVVANGEVFSCGIKQVRSKVGDVDWRVGGKKDLEFSRHPLPHDIAESCIKLVESLGLKFSALDLMLDPDGRYLFLESNASGAWGFVEKAVGFPISDAIAASLSKS